MESQGLFEEAGISVSYCGIGKVNAASKAAELIHRYGATFILNLGTAGSDQASSVAVDSIGNPYISGTTNGSLGGPNAGAQDFFLAKYDPAGNIQWSRQTGTGNREVNSGLAIDFAGNIFLCGSVIEPLADEYDLFTARRGFF